MDLHVRLRLHLHLPAWECGKGVVMDGRTERGAARGLGLGGRLPKLLRSACSCVSHRTCVAGTQPNICAHSRTPHTIYLSALQALQQRPGQAVIVGDWASANLQCLCCAVSLKTINPDLK